MDMIPRNSSNVQATGYDPESSTLHVRFTSGSTYAYVGVPPEIAEGIDSADSIGSYISRNVVRVLKGTLVPIEDQTEAHDSGDA